MLEVVVEAAGMVEKVYVSEDREGVMEERRVFRSDSPEDGIVDEGVDEGGRARDVAAGPDFCLSQLRSRRRSLLTSYSIGGLAEVVAENRTALDYVPSRSPAVCAAE